MTAERPVVLLNALATRSGGAVTRAQQVALHAPACWGARVMVAHHPRTRMSLEPAARAGLPPVVLRMPGITHRLLEAYTLRWMQRHIEATAVVHYGIWVPARFPPHVANVLYFTSLSPWAPGRESQRRRNRLRRRMFEATYGSATAVIVQSEASRSILTGVYPRLRGRVHVVHNGLVLPALTRPAATRGFVLVGDLYEYRRVDDVVRAYARLSDDIRREHPLTIVGSQDFNRDVAGRVAGLIEKEALGDVVRFTGALPRQDVLRLVASARAFVSFAEVENGPNAVAEAVGMGIPAILSDLPVHREYAGASATYASSIDDLTAAMTAAAGRPDESARTTPAIDTWPAHVAAVGRVLARIGALPQSPPAAIHDSESTP